MCDIKLKTASLYIHTQIMDCAFKSYMLLFAGIQKLKIKQTNKNNNKLKIKKYYHIVSAE